MVELADISQQLCTSVIQIKSCNWLKGVLQISSIPGVPLHMVCVAVA